MNLDFWENFPAKIPWSNNWVNHLGENNVCPLSSYGYVWIIGDAPICYDKYISWWRFQDRYKKDRYLYIQLSQHPQNKQFVVTFCQSYNNQQMFYFQEPNSKNQYPEIPPTTYTRFFMVKQNKQIRCLIFIHLYEKLVENTLEKSLTSACLRWWWKTFNKSSINNAVPAKLSCAPELLFSPQFTVS